MTTPVEIKTPVDYIPFGADVTSTITNAPSVDLEANVDGIISYLNTSPVSFFDISNTSAGLTLVLVDGVYNKNGTTIYVPGGMLSLVNDTSNFVRISTTSNTIISLTSPVTNAQINLYEVITSGGIVTQINDNRSFLSAAIMGTGGGFDADTVDGYHAGNATGQIPVSNAVLNINLNAQLLDGKSASNSSNQIPISNGVLNVNLNAQQLNGFTQGTAVGQIPRNNGALNLSLNANFLNGLQNSVNLLISTIVTRDGSGLSYTATAPFAAVFDTAVVNRQYYYSYMPLSIGASWISTGKSAGIWYTNSSLTSWRVVSITFTSTLGAGVGQLFVSTNGGVTSLLIANSGEANNSGVVARCTVYGLIPPGDSYMYSGPGVSSWLEAN